MKITIKRVNQLDFTVEADLESTVLEFKELISPQVSLPATHIRLICEGGIWEDRFSLNHYSISEDKPVHCLRYEPPSAGQPLITPNLPQPQNSPGEADFMQSMLNSPMMQQMFQNPDTMRSLMRMNPEMNELLERQPEMARLLDDPEILQQSLNAMRNPAMMREMMRQADRSMSNLETIPGGMNALRRMHNEFADPLYEAMHDSRNPGADRNTPREYHLGGDGPINDAPLPNPWASPSTGTTSVPPPSIPFGGIDNTTANASTFPETNNSTGNMPNMMSQLFGNTQGRQAQGGMNPFLSAFGGGFPASAPNPLSTGAPNAASPASGQNSFAAMMNMMTSGQGRAAAPMGGGTGGANSFLPFGFPNAAPAVPSSAPTIPPPQVDEVRISVRHGTATRKIILKKTDTVETLKEKLEPLINIRRQHIRLVRSGQLWDDKALPMESFDLPLDAEVFALKYVPPGQVDLGPPQPVAPVSQNSLLPGLFMPGMAGLGGIPPMRPAAPLLAPEFRYASELRQLADMGFTDQPICIRALQATNGDVTRALDMLLSNMP